MKRFTTAKLAISMLVVVVAIGLISIGTFASFGDSASSDDNQFTSGSIDIQVSNDGASWSDGTTGTWTMDNMKPGDIVDANLYVKNVGSIDVNSLLTKITLTGELADCTPNVNCGLADVIDMLEVNDDTSVGSGEYFVEYFKTVYDINDDDHLTLAEWDAAHSSDPSRAAYDTAWYCDGSGPAPGNLPCLLANGVPTNKGTPPNPYFFVHYKWQMQPDAGDEYQGESATFTLKVNGQQTWAPGMPGWPAENVSP